jgi:hypothetical protein
MERITDNSRGGMFQLSVQLLDGHGKIVLKWETPELNLPQWTGESAIVRWRVRI